MNSHHNPTDLWKETINPETGESSLATHTLKVVWKGCKPGECYYIDTDNPREKQCKHCKSFRDFTIGFHKLEDGKILPVK